MAQDRSDSCTLVVVGSLNIDLVTVTSRVPGPGETFKAVSFEQGFGGKGANQAVACARLSSAGAATHEQRPRIRVEMVGAVGEDAYARDFLQHLRTEAIGTDNLQAKKGLSTGTAVIIVEQDTGENRILITAGANDALTPQDVVLAPNTSLTVLQLEIPLPVVLHILKEAKSRGITTLLNPAPAIPLPDEVYKGLDHLIMNETEASILSGIPEARLSESLPHAVNHFIQLGVSTVVITLGGKGLYWKSVAKNIDGNVGGYLEARKVSVVDTTAAGDTFVGAYAVYLSMHGNNKLEEALKFATIAASISVQRKGAQSAIPRLAEVLDT